MIRLQTVLEALRQILGVPDFYKILPSSSSGYQNYSWDYAAMIEYLVGALILLCVVANVFKLLRCLFSK